MTSNDGFVLVGVISNGWQRAILRASIYRHFYMDILCRWQTFNLINNDRHGVFGLGLLYVCNLVCDDNTGILTQKMTKVWVARYVHFFRKLSAAWRIVIEMLIAFN